MKISGLEHNFVESFPDNPVDGILYISIPFASALHLCCCGCGNRVVTMFSPTDWSMTFDGKSISLWPSIGNWSFPCQSHYVISSGRVVDAPRWSRDKIDQNRAKDQALKSQHHGPEGSDGDGATIAQRRAGARALLDRIKSRLRGRS